MKYLLIVLSLAMCGCSNYVMISESKAGGMMAALSGDTKILKVTSNGEIGHISVKYVSKDGKEVYINLEPPLRPR